MHSHITKIPSSTAWVENPAHSTRTLLVPKVYDFQLLFDLEKLVPYLKVVKTRQNKLKTKVYYNLDIKKLEKHFQNVTCTRQEVWEEGTGLTGGTRLETYKEENGESYSNDSMEGP
ncbi:Nesprin-2 [Manis javanica]|nr:Nesprin-2 [Manis javanica]